MQNITQDFVRSIFDYHPDGYLVWKERRNGIRPDRKVGSKTDAGYIITGLNGKYIYVHRLIWLWHTGKHPEFELDHIDCVKDNNRIENLREASRLENSCNKKLRKDSTSGFKGVSWHKRVKQWQARVCFNKKRHHLGYFDTPEEASAAYELHAQQLHKEFTRLS